MDILLYVCAAISTVGAAITVIYNTASKAKQPWDSLMSRMMAVEAKLAEHDRHFASDLERIRAMEAENAEVLKALFALLSHAADGNSIQRCKDAKVDLQEFLSKKGVLI